jgi:DNA mismatch repair protein MutS
MAQSGLFVPCSSFEFMPYKYIFTRILGNDNLFKGLSTFAVEMSELRTILKLADPNSLILGDELCSGTEIVSAISIFVSGLQQLYKLGSSYIFATHLHEIVDYDEIKEISTLSIMHMEVVYDKERDILIYDRKLKEGPGNNMYGLEVCKSLKLPEEFLNNAFEIRSKYNDQYRSILSFKTSRYNAKKIMGMCENCGERMGTEVHHLQHQRDANEEGIITNSNMSFHKNNLANLLTLCETCHHETHSTNDIGSKKVKTSKGYVISSI